ncbi:hypothetical protein EIP91_010467 [Steccherinum ochraceum]|uniref:DUF7598 domain-containing protein n=1 Tax=Steccherinum ochraceum TaxID=92696 RepID=A0A4R0RMY8_9APHY|nr:hypothetical protein EIP91_010467 [Steccherinum ochraceum]
MGNSHSDNHAPHATVVSTKPTKQKVWQFITLNVIRGLSIFSLTLLFASSIVTLVNDIRAVDRFVKNSCTGDDCDYVTGSTVPNQAAGEFWAILNRLLIIFQAIVLIGSEVGWPQAFFNRYFPILGYDFGLGPLGIIQGLLGAAVLSHHVDTFSLASSFLLFSMACINMLLGLIFRDKARPIRSIRAHRNGKKDVLPSHGTHSVGSISGPIMSEKEKEALGIGRSDSVASSSSGKSGMGFGRQGTKAAEAKGFHVRQPEESVPPYAPKPREPKQATSPQDTLVFSMPEPTKH